MYQYFTRTLSRVISKITFLHYITITLQYPRFHWKNPASNLKVLFVRTRLQNAIMENVPVNLTTINYFMSAVSTCNSYI